MTNFMDMGEPTPSRLAAGLELILEGHSVGFGDFSLYAHDGTLFVSLYYPHSSGRNDTLAAEIVSETIREVDTLMDVADGYREGLAGLPRRVELVVDLGKSEVKVADIIDGRPIWIEYFK
jgi:hypothetical protein